MLSFFERLDKFMEFNSLNDNKITVEAGISNGIIGKARKRGSLSQENISKILNAYPSLNATWLLTGKGEMLNNSSAEGVNQTIHGNNNQQAGKTITNADNARLADRIKELEKQIENKDALINSLMKQLDKLTDKL